MGGTNIVLPTEGSHFYLANGQPLYEVPNKSKPGTMRPATLRDARQAGALPSVTTVMDVLEKPALTAWKINNAILAAATMPRKEGESADEWAHRVAEDADSTSRTAMDLGTRAHDAIESYYAGRLPNIPDDMVPFVNPIISWCGENAITILDSEKICINTALQYGCRVDALGTCGDKPVIIDWKTQGKPKEKLAAYDDNLYQLVANAFAAGLDPISPSVYLYNVYISTVDKDENGNAEIMVKHWQDQEEIKDAWEVFCHCRDLYKLRNGL